MIAAGFWARPQWVSRSPVPPTCFPHTRQRPKATPSVPSTSRCPKRRSSICASASNATRWPDRETVKDPSQGVQLATIQKLARYWATDYDWRKVEAKLNALPQFITEIDGRRHSFHSRSLEARECVADHRHARMARLDHRAAEDHRSADQSHGAWRERIGRVRSGDSVDARLRLFGQADHDRAGTPSASHAPGSC